MIADQLQLLGPVSALFAAYVLECGVAIVVELILPECSKDISVLVRTEVSMVVSRPSPFYESWHWRHDLIVDDTRGGSVVVVEFVSIVD